jgi:hypothetical protein
MNKCGLPQLLYRKKSLITINLIFENTKEPQDLSCPTQTHSSIQEHWVDISGRGNIPLIRISKPIWGEKFQGFQRNFFIFEEFCCLKSKSKASVKKLSKL